MPIVAKTDFNLGTKILIYISTVGFGLLAAWDAIDILHKPKIDFGHLYFVCLPLFIVCIAGFAYLMQHKVLLTDTTLIQYGFRTKCILLKDIESITENLGAYLIKSNKTSIRITTGLQNKDEFKKLIIHQFKKNEALAFHIPGKQLDVIYAHKLIEQVHSIATVVVQANNVLEIEASNIEQLTESAYYLIYEHSIHNFLHRAYDAETHQVKQFAYQQAASEAEVNAGIWILPHSLEWLILLNKGKIFFMRKD